MNETRSMILHKAFMLFLQNGYDGVSMLKLQQETKLSRGALYHHFKSKEQLFSEVIDTFYIATPTTPIKPLDITSLFAFYNGYYEHTAYVFKLLSESMKELNSETNFSFFALGIDAIKRYHGFSDKMRHINEEVRKIWVYVIKMAREKGEIETEMTDDQIAACFLYLSEGIGTHFTLEGRGIDAGNELINLWNSFYNQLKSIK